MRRSLSSFAALPLALVALVVLAACGSSASSGCMSPYPSLPWKNDWTTTDRTQALNSVPLFEEAIDIYRFRVELRYEGDSSAARPPAPEYLMAYWFARKYNLLNASD